MDMNYIHNIGALVDVVTSVPPQSAAAGTIAGTSIDRALHGMSASCVLHQVVGADSGAPTTLSVQTTLQHAPDNATWTNYEPNGVLVAQTAPLTAVSTENAVAIDLTAAYRYIRASTVVAFTGGTSPAIEVAADLVLGGERELPAT